MLFCMTFRSKSQNESKLSKYQEAFRKQLGRFKMKQKLNDELEYPWHSDPNREPIRNGFLQRLPQNGLQNKHLPQNAPQRNQVSQNAIQNKHLPQSAPQRNQVSQNAMQNKHLPQNAMQNKHLPQSAPQSKHLPQSAPQSKHLPQNAPQNKHLPQNAPHRKQVSQNALGSYSSSQDTLSGYNSLSNENTSPGSSRYDSPEAGRRSRDRLVVNDYLINCTPRRSSNRGRSNVRRLQEMFTPKAPHSNHAPTQDKRTNDPDAITKRGNSVARKRLIFENLALEQKRSVSKSPPRSAETRRCHTRNRSADDVLTKSVHDKSEEQFHRQFHQTRPPVGYSRSPITGTLITTMNGTSLESGIDTCYTESASKTFRSDQFTSSQDTVSDDEVLNGKRRYPRKTTTIQDILQWISPPPSSPPAHKASQYPDLTDMCRSEQCHNGHSTRSRQGRYPPKDRPQQNGVVRNSPAPRFRSSIVVGAQNQTSRDFSHHQRDITPVSKRHRTVSPPSRSPPRIHSPRNRQTLSSKPPPKTVVSPRSVHQTPLNSNLSQRYNYPASSRVASMHPISSAPSYPIVQPPQTALRHDSPPEPEPPPVPPKLYRLSDSSNQEYLQRPLPVGPPPPKPARAQKDISVHPSSHSSAVHNFHSQPEVVTVSSSKYYRSKSPHQFLSPVMSTPTPPQPPHRNRRSDFMASSPNPPQSDITLFNSPPEPCVVSLIPPPPPPRLYPSPPSKPPAPIPPALATPSISPPSCQGSESPVTRLCDPLINQHLRNLQHVYQLPADFSLANLPDKFVAINQSPTSGIYSGNHQGNHQGNFSGNQSGNQSSNHQGSHSGNQSGNQSGNHQGNFSGNQQGNHLGNQSGNHQSNFSTDSVTPSLTPTPPVLLRFVDSPSNSSNHSQQRVPVPGGGGVIGNQAPQQQQQQELYPYDVLVNRRENEGFGFVIISSVTRAGSVIGRIIENSPAERCKRLHVGDRILAVNKTSIMHMHHEDIVNLIKESGTSVTLTVGPPLGEKDDASSTASTSQRSSQGSMINAMAFPTHSESDLSRRSDYSPYHYSQAGQDKQKAAPPMQRQQQQQQQQQQGYTEQASMEEDEQDRFYAVELHRGSRGFGFSIRGGKEFNNMSLYVLRIADGGAADVDRRLRVGDQIIEINGYNTSNMTHAEAIDLIQNGGGSVKMLVKRQAKVPQHLGGAQSGVGNSSGGVGRLSSNTPSPHSAPPPPPAAHSSPQQRLLNNRHNDPMMQQQQRHNDPMMTAQQQRHNDQMMQQQQRHNDPMMQQRHNDPMLQRHNDPMMQPQRHSEPMHQQQQRHNDPMLRPYSDPMQPPPRHLDHMQQQRPYHNDPMLQQRHNDPMQPPHQQQQQQYNNPHPHQQQYQPQQQQPYRPQQQYT